MLSKESEKRLCENIFKRLKKGETKAFLDSHCEYIGHGASREVYRLGNLALKLARNNFGLEQNHLESEAYESAKGKVKELLCPIIWHSDDYALVISKFTEPLLRVQAESNWEEEIEFTKGTNLIGFMEDNKLIIGKLFKCGVLKDDLSRASAWGKTEDDKMVIVDYGYGRKDYGHTRGGYFSKGKSVIRVA